MTLDSNVIRSNIPAARPSPRPAGLGRGESPTSSGPRPSAGSCAVGSARPRGIVCWSAISSETEDAMNDPKAQLARWIDEDREKIVGFLCDFVRAKSPNPPGDTRLAAAHVTRFLEASGLPFRVIAPEPTMPNIVGSFDTGKPGHHLVLNGHMDVFPADVAVEGWTQDPWGGAIANGKIYGRGVADMKAGTSASLSTFYYLHR